MARVTPPAVQKLPADKLRPATRERLRALATRSKEIVARDNMGMEVGAILLGLVIIGINIGLSTGIPRIAIATAIGGALIAFGVWKIRKRAGGVGTFIEPTAAYMIAADGNDVVFYSWAACADIRLTDRYVNGVFVACAVDIDFGAVLRIDAPNRDAATALAKRYAAYAEEARNAANAGAWSSLEGADLV